MRNIRAAALFLTVFFAIGMFAQSSPGQMGTNPQTAPGQQPQMNPPSQGMPSAQPGQAAQQPSQPSQGQSNIDNQVQILTQELSLTSEQQNKVRSILTDQHEQAMTLVKDTTMSRDDKMNKLHSLRENTISKVRDVLNADQKPKFDSMVQQQNERMRQRQEQSGENNSGANPSGSGTNPSGTNPSSTGTTPPSTSTPPSSTQPGSVKPPQ
jgi:hypothetical protein